MNIQDTLSNTEQKLDNSEKIKIYLCGVTVYDESHIGHARTIIVFDVLRKYLESKKQQVELIQNFTDVDDKIINRAKDEKVSAQEISKRYIDNYFRDFDKFHGLLAGWLLGWLSWLAGWLSCCASKAC